MNVRLLFVVVLFFLGFLVLAHQAIIWGKWFEPDQFLHHENIAAIIFAFALGILVCIETKRTP